MNASVYVLILAGGSGERFWPLSRKTRPKQLLALLGEECLLEATVKRLAGIVPMENVLILTNSEQEQAVRALAMAIPAENILAEPAKRDTAAAIALGVGLIAARDPEATMIVLPADHVIQDQAAFKQTLLVAVSAARKSGDLVTIGIQPTWACSGFGYIEQGEAYEKAEGAEGPAVFEVRRFREKPSPSLAESFLEQGNFRWNAGMFIWTIAAIEAAFRTHAPELAQFVDSIRKSKSVDAFLLDAFPRLPKISIDYAILEKAGRVLMVEASFDWDDVGSWTAIAKYFAADEFANVSNRPLKVLQANRNLVYSNQKTQVALLGVNDLIVVQTEDALLVCHRNDAENIKQLLTVMPQELQ